MAHLNEEMYRLLHPWGLPQIFRQTLRNQLIIGDILILGSQSCKYKLAGFIYRVMFQYATIRQVILQKINSGILTVTRL